jgi:hypothetical protein
MLELYNWISVHKEDIVAAYGCAVAFCTAVVKIFPSHKTGGLWGTFIKIIDYLSTAYTDTDKEKLKK